MGHFQVLPTDPRILELSDEQIDILFVYHLMCPDDSELKELYRRNSKAEQLKEALPVNVLKQQGFTDEMIEQIKNDVARGVK